MDPAGSQLLPFAPPADVSAEVAAAGRRAARLAAEGRTLHFTALPGRRVAIETRGPAGAPGRRLTPSQALAVACGRREP